MSIYIIKNNQQSGPFEENFVLSWLNNGQLLPNDLAIRHGGNQWQTLGTMFSFQKPNEQNVANFGALNNSKQLIANWATQNINGRTEVKLKYNSLAAKIILALFVFCLPIAATIYGIVMMILSGFTSQSRAIFALAGFLYVLFAFVGAFSLLISYFTRRKIVRFIDAEGVETRNKTKYCWEELQYLNYRKFRNVRGNLIAALIQSILFAGSDRIIIDLIFSNGKAIIAPLIFNQREINGLLGTIPAQHKGRNQ